MTTDLFKEPYAEEETTLNEWVDNLVSRINIYLFHHQEDYLYMSGELGEGRFPQLKDEDKVYRAIETAFDSEISWLFQYVMERIVRQLRLSNIDLGESMEDWLREEMGDEYFKEWEEAAKKQIFDDYAEHLGIVDTIKLFAENWE